MKKFVYYNPVRIVFGENRIETLKRWLPKDAKVLIVIGGGSVRKNGVLDRVETALEGIPFEIFAGMEANPDHATCLKAVERIRETDANFLLAVGGGSVIDGTKYIAAAAKDKGDPWDLVTGKREVSDALPIGCVLTLAATASEMNGGAVISRRETGDKFAFGSEWMMPRFSILDPTATVSVSPHMSACGVVDAFVHVMEQYLTHVGTAPLQDRQAEAILSTLMEEGPKVLEDPQNLEVRGNILWCATQALNGLIGSGVPQDWASHMIGHELTAAFGLAHAESLAVVMPALWKTYRDEKGEKLAQFAKRVLKVEEENTERGIERAISETEAFFERLGVHTRLTAYEVMSDDALFIADRIGDRGWKLGENQQIDADGIRAILKAAA